jgi:hypothetical protein
MPRLHRNRRPRNRTLPTHCHFQSIDAMKPMARATQILEYTGFSTVLKRDARESQKLQSGVQCSRTERHFTTGARRSVTSVVLFEWIMTRCSQSDLAAPAEARRSYSPIL